MAESSGEKSRILIAGAGMSVRAMKSPELMPERNAPGLGFWDIQNELLKLKDKPDPVKENELKLQRARLLSEAKDIGVFDTIKPLLLEIQSKRSFGDALDEISHLNINELETVARGVSGWKDEFSGMIEHYRDGALRNMEMALLEATGNGKTPRAVELKKEKELLGWGAPPTGLDLLVRQTPEQRAGAIDTRALAREMAKAQGLEPPEMVLEDFREGEEYLKPTTVISPGNEPRFFVLLNEEEKREWYVRSTLIIAGYKKSMAKGTDELYMDNMREFAVDLNKTAMRRIFNKPGVLPAVGIYSTIIGDPKFLSYKDKDDLSLKTVFCDVLTDRNLREGLKRDYGDDILDGPIEIGTDNKIFEPKTYKGLVGLQDQLYNGCADSFYPHSKNWGTTIEEASFRDLKKSVRFWLITKGRDLLLTNAEKSNRDRFFGNESGQFATEEERGAYKKEVFKKLCERARDAEQIAWNFAFVTDIIETFDSREYRPAGTPRHPPSNYWTLFQWVPMHPQERFEAKIKRTQVPEVSIKGARGVTHISVMSDDLSRRVGVVEVGAQFDVKDTRFMGGQEYLKIEATDGSDGWISNDSTSGIPHLEAKEDWSNFGTWGIYNLTHGEFRDGRGRFRMPEGLKILPDTLIRGPLFTSQYEGRGQESSSLFAVFNGIGNDVLNRTDLAASDDLFNRINWDGMNDSPFVPFIFDEMRWADAVTNVFKKGGERDSKVDGRLLSEAVNNLRLTRRQREVLLISYLDRPNPTSNIIRPAVSSMRWGDRRAAFLEKFPNYFLGT